MCDRCPSIATLKIICVFILSTLLQYAHERPGISQFKSLNQLKLKVSCRLRSIIDFFIALVYSIQYTHLKRIWTPLILHTIVYYTTGDVWSGLENMIYEQINYWSHPPKIAMSYDTDPTKEVQTVQFGQNCLADRSMTLNILSLLPLWMACRRAYKRALKFGGQMWRSHIEVLVVRFAKRGHTRSPLPVHWLQPTRERENRVWREGRNPLLIASLIPASWRGDLKRSAFNPVRQWSSVERLNSGSAFNFWFLAVPRWTTKCSTKTWLCADSRRASIHWRQSPQSDQWRLKPTTKINTFKW